MINRGSDSAVHWARTTFAVLFAIHLLDYTDRWALSGVNTILCRDLKMSDAQFGFLNVPFLATFSIISPLMGWLGDRFRRTRLLAFGIGLWSLATIGTGLASDYNHLCIARAFLGIGEATYGVLAPTILTDLFRRGARARILSAFYLAMPFGYAIGVAGGGAIAANSPQWLAGTPLEAWAGWRMAFFVVGLPGIIAASAALFLPEPTRGASEDVDPERIKTAERVLPTRDDYIDLSVNSSYTYVVFGMTAFTFAFGGLAIWLPGYLERFKGFTQPEATQAIGICVGIGSVLGMALGGFLADLLSRKNPRALFYVPAMGMLIAVPFILMGLLGTSKPFIVISMFIAVVLMLMNTGPCNAVIANVVAPNMRAVAYSVSIFTVHMLGDLWSPWLMGKTADLTGKPDTMATFYGQALQSIGAVPKNGSNLTAGMLVVVPAIAIGGLVLLAGARHLPREMALMLAKLRATPKAPPPV
jgi:MFS transporter, Spinster family, sphingosine-1-phosphate transporter